MARVSERKDLLNAARNIRVTEYLHYRELLSELYSKTKSQADSYSYLKFADQLGFGSTNVLRLIIIGERHLTSKAARKISLALNWRNYQRLYFETLVEYNNARSPDLREQLFARLLQYKGQSNPDQSNDMQFEYFNEWHTPVIREMLGLDDMQNTSEAIQKRLKFPLRLDEINRSVETLMKINAIQWDEQTGRYVLKDRHIITEGDLDSLAIVRFHQKMIEIAKESITRIDEDQREIGAATILLPKSSIADIKQKVQQFLRSLLEYEEEIKTKEKHGVHVDEKEKEIFQVNVQFFPFTGKD